jgi:multiple sugar transport system ATP-binding protein
MVSVKAEKSYRIRIGDKVSISVPNEICHLFDTETGERIGG